jgi:hypothetical protein
MGDFTTEMATKSHYFIWLSGARGLRAWPFLCDFTKSEEPFRR